MTESVLDRKLIGKLTVEKVLHIALFVIAVGLCTYSLGVRPYHHDESIHAFYSWKIAENGVDIYRQDFNFDPLPYWREADEEDPHLTTCDGEGVFSAVRTR